MPSASSIDELLNEGGFLEVLSFLSPRDLRTLSLTNKILNEDVDDLLSDRRNEAQYLRKESTFNITVQPKDGTSKKRMYLREFLKSAKKHDVTAVDQISRLFSEQPDTFLKILPYFVPRNIISPAKISTFYKEDIKVGSLLKDLPTYSSTSEKLAAVFIELSLWGIVWDQARDLVWEEIWKKNHSREVWNIVDEWDQAWSEVWDPILEGSSGDTARKIKRRITYNVWQNLKTMVINEIRTPFKRPIVKKLRYFKFKSLNREADLGYDRVNSALNYSLSIFQLASIIMRQNSELKKIHSDLVAYIEEVIRDRSKMESLLGGIPIPEDGENPLVNLQLQMLRRHY